MCVQVLVIAPLLLRSAAGGNEVAIAATAAAPAPASYEKLLCILVSVLILLVSAIWMEVRCSRRKLHFHKSCQSQTSYGEARGQKPPRFNPLSEGCHGCWPG